MSLKVQLCSVRHARCRSAARAVHAAAAQHASLAVHSSASRSPYCTRRSRCGGDACAARCAACATRGAAVQRVQLAVLCTPLPTASVQCTSGRSRFCDDARTARRAAVQRASLADSPCSAAPTALPAAARNVPMEPRRSRCRGAAVPRCRGVAVRGRAARCAGLQCETLVVQRCIGCRARGSGAVGVNTTQLPAPGGLQARLLKGVVMCHDCASLWWRWRTSAARGTAKPAIVEILRQTVAGLMYVENDAVTTFTGTVTPVTRDSNSTSSC